MKFLLVFGVFCIISAKIIKADINDFIVTEEHYKNFLGSSENEHDLLQTEDEYYGEMAEYDSCGYGNPAQQYLYGQEDDQLFNDYSNDDVMKSNALHVLENMLRNQKISYSYLQQLFAQLSSNPKYTEIFQQVMAEEGFDDQPGCAQSPAIDVFSNSFNDDDFLL